MEFKKATIYLDESRIKKCKKLENHWMKMMDEFDPGFTHKMTTSALIQRCIDATYDIYFEEEELPFN